MKKTFLAKRNALFTRSSFSVGAGVFLVVILFALLRILTPNFFLQVFAPLLKVGDAIETSVQTTLSGFKNTQVLATENQTLTAENAALTDANRALTEKNADLVALVGKEPADQSAIVAGVLSRPPESAYDTLIVDAGTNVGVALGMEAFGPGGVPAGVVTATSATFSRITLFSAAGSHVGAWIGKSRLPITLYGAGGGAFHAELPKAATVALGDGVFVPGPGALPVGTLTRLDSNPSSPTATLLIAPALNPFSIPWVELKDTGAQFRSALVATSTKL